MNASDIRNLAEAIAAAVSSVCNGDIDTAAATLDAGMRATGLEFCNAARWVVAAMTRNVANQVRHQVAAHLPPGALEAGHVQYVAATRPPLPLVLRDVADIDDLFQALVIARLNGDHDGAQLAIDGCGPGEINRLAGHGLYVLANLRTETP